MGYYTDYLICFIGDDDKVEAFKKDLLKESMDDDGEIDDALMELLVDNQVYAKLYDLDKWISNVAPRHPDVMIRLMGDGEQSDDLWESRWKGKDFETQYAQMPPFTTPSLIVDLKNNN